MSERERRVMCQTISSLQCLQGIKQKDHTETGMRVCACVCVWVLPRLTGCGLCTMSLSSSTLVICSCTASESASPKRASSTHEK